jgi:hypothetical protein
MTDLQNKMLIAIAHSDYSPTNSIPPKNFEETGPIWISDIVNTPEQKGVLTSLVNAGMVITTVYPNKNENTVELTTIGFAAYQEAMRPIKEAVDTTIERVLSKEPEMINPKAKLTVAEVNRLDHVTFNRDVVELLRVARVIQGRIVQYGFSEAQGKEYCELLIATMLD